MTGVVEAYRGWKEALLTKFNVGRKNDKHLISWAEAHVSKSWLILRLTKTYVNFGNQIDRMIFLNPEESIRSSAVDALVHDETAATVTELSPESFLYAVYTRRLRTK